MAFLINLGALIVVGAIALVLMTIGLAGVIAFGGVVLAAVAALLIAAEAALLELGWEGMGIIVGLLAALWLGSNLKDRDGRANIRQAGSTALKIVVAITVRIFWIVCGLVVIIAPAILGGGVAFVLGWTDEVATQMFVFVGLGAGLVLLNKILNERDKRKFRKSHRRDG